MKGAFVYSILLSAGLISARAVPTIETNVFGSTTFGRRIARKGLAVRADGSTEVEMVKIVQALAQSDPEDAADLKNFIDGNAVRRQQRKPLTSRKS